MSLQSFYAEKQLRDLFDATEDRDNPHRGLDVAGHPLREPVPAWVEGEVVTSEWDDALGWVIAVASPFGFAGVSHLDEQGAPVGAIVKVGQPWGLLGNSGRLSFGKHAHLTLSKTSRKPWTGLVIDPLPFIRAARDASAAAGGGTATIGDIMATGIIVRADDGPEPSSFPEGISRGDVFYLDLGTAVHIGPSEDGSELDRAERLIGRGKAADQTIAEINTFCSLFGIPGNTLRPGVKYHG